MGFNLGTFAGGAADGYRKQNEDLRRQSEEKRKQDEAERQDAERKQLEEIVKSTHGEFREGLKTAGGETMPMRDAYGAEPAKPGMVVDGIISNQVAGRQPVPASVNSIVAQGVGGSTAAPQPSGKPLSVAAQGIVRQEPTYREPDINDKFGYADKLYGRLIEAGLFDKAKEVGQFRSGLLAEKLQGETKAREDAVRGGVAAIKSRNPKAILAALQSVSRFVPDGNDVTDVQMSGDGKYQITYGDNPPIAMDEVQLTSSILGAGKVETILDYDHRLQQTAFQKAQEDRQTKKDDRDAKHQTDTLKVTKDHYERSDATANIKARDGSESTTAEVKNARAFFPELYAKNPAKALSAFKDITTGENTAAGVRKSLFTTYAKDDTWPEEAGTTTASRDAFLNNRVKFVMGKGEDPASSGAPQDVMVGGKVIGQAATAEEAKAMVAQHVKQAAQPAQPSNAQLAPSIVQQPVAQNIKTAAKPRDVRVIQAELNQLKELPSYVNQDVKNAQRAKYAALMAERDAAMGNKPAATSVGRYGVGR